MVAIYIAFVLPGTNFTSFKNEVASIKIVCHELRYHCSRSGDASVCFRLSACSGESVVCSTSLCPIFSHFTSGVILETGLVGEGCVSICVTSNGDGCPHQTGGANRSAAHSNYKR